MIICYSLWSFNFPLVSYWLWFFTKHPNTLSGRATQCFVRKKSTSSLAAEKKIIRSILILWIPQVAQLDYEFIMWQRGCASASNTCLGFSTAIFHKAQWRTTSILLLRRLRQLRREIYRQLSRLPREDAAVSRHSETAAHTCSGAAESLCALGLSK